jgi:ribosome-associated toxin RatA of RatAB toxin-antitoxin module
MAVSQAQMFKVITDFPAYPQFVSEVVSAKVEPGGNAKKFQVTFELEIVKRFEYTLEFEVRGKEEVRWKLAKSNFFKTNEGRWLLESLGPEKTRVVYEVDVGFGFLVPGWISRKLTETTLPKMLENFEARAKTVGKSK